eukprot:363712-Chlamydomonas_euryale.AAC.6
MHMLRGCTQLPLSSGRCPERPRPPAERPTRRVRRNMHTSLLHCVPARGRYACCAHKQVRYTCQHGHLTRRA